jgi:hypothetical protein
MPKLSHYPSYDVMEQKNEWDNHTQSIVTARLVREHEYRFLTITEAETLRAVCSLLVDDDRPELIQYAVSHIDETLNRPYGESERKTNVPVLKQLIRDGIEFLEKIAAEHYVKPFFRLERSEQLKMITSLSEGQAHIVLSTEYGHIPQKDLFKKLLTLTTEAYYSHPTVWSEIGYGGPAYPRGYVRTQKGQLDPWEAQPE